MQELAPIALFAYQRPDHLNHVLSALKRNSLACETELFVFTDGARGALDRVGVEEVRQVVRGVEGFKRVTVIESLKNRGLAASLLGGIDYMFQRWDRIIVLEDDIVVAPHFLRYMNDHLALYQDDDSVASIHAYVYPCQRESSDTTFFIRGADCWGWGTWRRAWEAFQPDGERLLAELRARGLVDVLNFEGTAPFEEMLIDQIEGRNDSWAVRWYASALLNGMHTLYPGQPLAINIGEDGSGTHRGTSSTYQQQLAPDPVKVERIPIAESAEAREAFREFFRTRYRIPSSRVGRWAWRRARRLKNRLPY